MAIRITEECINCGACEPECPNNAIYEGGESWKFSDKTNLKGIVDGIYKKGIDADSGERPISNEIYYIVPDKCTECVGFYDEPQCAAVCPVDCCIEDENIRETREQLLSKYEWMHSK